LRRSTRKNSASSQRRSCIRLFISMTGLRSKALPTDEKRLARIVDVSNANIHMQGCSKRGGHAQPASRLPARRLAARSDRYFLGLTEKVLSSANGF
jgi:hypothetical protein